MKWLSLFIVALAAISLGNPCKIYASSGNKVEIQSITHSILPDGKESITFTLSQKAVPKVFTMNSGNPRLVLDFPGGTYAGKDVLPSPGAKLATAIRIGLHKAPEQKVRVVVDLARDISVSHVLREYSEADRTLTVELASSNAAQQQKPQKEAKEAAAAEPKPETKLPSAEELAAKPLNQKPVPPVLHHKEEKIEPSAGEKANAAEPPQLLDISFDGNSKKGEMVLFHLNNFYPPTVSAVEKDKPRVLCDFMGMNLGAKVQVDIPANGKFVQRIHTNKMKKPDKIQVVLELAPERDYDLQQVFFKKDNLFVLIVNELEPEKKAGN